ncbi:hypothetical protein DFH07DRAFT_965184 [Mycena maculata]|uniref:Uncharacterized protein n=1 Tax=Mycena maculata TaxID=230809 RepID=A0AAD7IDZ9_9AGAR|nr:hypothetical protein DFH07DRAFT_965184 [Mycena maculata]
MVWTGFAGLRIIHENRGLYNLCGAMIITGLPGIGKTCFLDVLFHLRVAAGLPTLYMDNPKSVMLYDNGQFGDIEYPTKKKLRMNLLEDVWCLIDSNKSFDTVPPEVLSSALFVVQASSPRFCLMALWTLSELMAGFSLTGTAESYQEIKTFYERFGGSARHVFGKFSNLNDFERKIDLAANNLSAKVIEKILQSRHH